MSSIPGPALFFCDTKSIKMINKEIYYHAGSSMRVHMNVEQF